MAGKAWAEQENEAVRALFPDNPTVLVAELLGRSYKATALHAVSLGVVKSEAYNIFYKMQSAKVLKSVGVKYQFGRGQTPFNKGKKQTDWISECKMPNVKKGQFKKGERPITAPPPNTVTIRTHKGTGQTHKYMNNRMLHYIEWEKVNGPVPKGHILACKTGDTLNEHPDNWELISRAENMRRNSIQRFPSEVIQVIKVNAKLKKLINEQENN